jgi:hypothetical protein
MHVMKSVIRTLAKRFGLHISPKGVVLGQSKAPQGLIEVVPLVAASGCIRGTLPETCGPQMETMVLQERRHS